MNPKTFFMVIAALAGHSAWAHVTYTNRDFGIFQANGLEAPVLFIGGADYGTQGPAPYTSYTISPTVTVVPEAGSAMLLVAGASAS